MEFHYLVGYGLSALAIIAMIVIHLDSRKRKKEIDDLKRKLDDRDDEIDKLNLFIEGTQYLHANVDVNLLRDKTLEVPDSFPDFDNAVKERLEQGGYVDQDDLIRIGNVWYVKGDLLKAASYYEVVRDRASEARDSQREGNALGNIGLIYQAKGDLDKALKYHKDALKIDREIGYREGEANQLGNIGLIYIRRGDLDEALKYHKDALVIHREVGYRQGEASVVGNIGVIYVEKGDLDEELRAQRGALVIRGV